MAIGGALTLKLALRSSSAWSQRLVIDYAVHHVKADDCTEPVLGGFDRAVRVALRARAPGRARYVRRSSARSR